MPAASDPWYEVSNVGDIESPALLIYHTRAIDNIARMIARAGGVARLRPHIKTHKLPPLVAAHRAAGITKFKCSTIAEAELLGHEGAPDVLLAYQPVGPNVARLCRLVQSFPATRFSALVDNPGVAQSLSRAAVANGMTLDLFVDLDVGMSRTGVAPGADALALYRQITETPGLRAAGLHAYDGHIRDSDPLIRKQVCDRAFAPVTALRDAIVASGLEVPSLVAGGTPTFPIHAQRPDVDCSPGTCVLWDAGYSAILPDLDFVHAALVLTRVVSTPGADRVCLDLGHKAIASENPHPRVVFLNLDDATAVGHSEEHLVLTMPGVRPAPGTPIYGVPWHICPTVALYSEAVVIDDGRADTRWRITGRERRLTV
jgi:D-serine deaminase-like pyridoxal phosphate-dependent protein